MSQMKPDLRIISHRVELQELRLRRKQLDRAIKAIESLDRIRTLRPENRLAVVRDSGFEMNNSWDDRPVVRCCARCGGDVQTTAHVRGKIHCPACRAASRRESMSRANNRARNRRMAGREPGVENGFPMAAVLMGVPAPGTTCGTRA